MMITKIFSVDKIRNADRYTIDNEPISSIDLMERAAHECFIWLAQKARKNQEFAIFCGPGNNGGDGLAIARMLSKKAFKVQGIILDVSGKFSADFLQNYTRLKEQGLAAIEEWKEIPKEFPKFTEDCIIVDAIFGSGLSKPLKAMPQKVVLLLNELPQIKVSIDIPTGLFADQPVEDIKDTVLVADYSLSFQFPKMAFLIPENELFVGEWYNLDIGLSQKYIQSTLTDDYYLTHAFVHSLIRGRAKYSHKGNFGHVLMIAGDHSKMGAAILSSKAALRVGAGLVSLHHPASAHMLIPMAVPEVMSSLDDSDVAFSTLPDLAKYTHVAVGPGLGTRKQTAKALKLLVQEVSTPMVFDADALYILSENKTWLSFLPKNSILTPHLGELNRLLGKTKDGFHRIEKARDFTKKYQLYLIVKGAHTAIVTPTGKVYYNSTGNPGMATGGSGDVLTGMLVGLLAQHYTPLEAALLGVYLHGLAGDISAAELGMESMIAGDIVNHIAQAYQLLRS